MSDAATKNDERMNYKQRLMAFAIVTFAVVLTSIIRISGPFDLLDDDQQRPASYVLDLLNNGNLIVQEDSRYDVMSKPPLSTWVTAFVAWMWGGLDKWSLYLPSALSTLAIAWMILAGGMRILGDRVGLIAAIIYVCSSPTETQAAMARTDPIFSALAIAALLAAFRAWRSGSGWLWVWLILALSNLTKGPLALPWILAALGAAWWMKDGKYRNLLKWQQIVGILLFVLIGAGWFWLAVNSFGDRVIEKMIGKELVGHAVDGGGRDRPLFSKAHRPSMYFVWAFIPWSFATIAGLWRIIRRPSVNDEQRAFERLLFLYFVSAIVLFSIPTHHRYIHLWPLHPAAALIAAIEINRWIKGWNSKRLLAAATALGIIVPIASGIGRHAYAQNDPLVNDMSTLGEIANHVGSAFGGDYPFVYGQVPFGLQFYLGSMRQSLDKPTIARALSSDLPCYALIEYPIGVSRSMDDPDSMHILASWELQDQGEVFFVSNRPDIVRDQGVATYAGHALLVEADGLAYKGRTRERLFFDARERTGVVRVTNVGDDPLPVVIEIQGLDDSVEQRVVLDGENWIEREWKGTPKNYVERSHSRSFLALFVGVIFSLGILFLGAVATLKSIKTPK